MVVPLNRGTQYRPNAIILIKGTPSKVLLTLGNPLSRASVVKGRVVHKLLQLVCHYPDRRKGVYSTVRGDISSYTGISACSIYTYIKRY